MKCCVCVLGLKKNQALGMYGMINTWIKCVVLSHVSNGQIRLMASKYPDSKNKNTDEYVLQD